MMKSIASENAESDLDEVLSNSQIEQDTKQSKQKKREHAPSLSNHNTQSVDDQTGSLDSLKIIQESKRSSFLISNTRKLQILKQIHLMNPEELYEVCLQILQKSSAERNHFDLQILQKTFQSIEFFQKFEEQSGSNALLNLYKMLKLETYDIHDLVIQQGTRGDRFFIILQGSVGVFIKPATTNSQLPSNTQILNSQVTSLSKEANKTNNQFQQSPTQSHSTNNANLNFTQASRNAPSPFARQQSPVESVKNNTIHQTCISLNNQGVINRNRNDSNDNPLNNQSINIPTFSNITSDTVLQDNHGQSLHQQAERRAQSQLKKEGENNSGNKQQQPDQMSQLKNSNSNKTTVKRKKNIATDQSQRQKSEFSIPLNLQDEFNDDSIKIDNQKISQSKDQSRQDLTKQNSNIVQMPKPSFVFQDNQSQAFLSILKNKNEQERTIFPPHEQKYWINVNQLKAGQSFGELALLNDAPRMANVVCNSICHFAVLNKKDFKEAIASIESQKIKGYIQFLQQVPGFDKISRRALNMIIYSFDIKTFTFRDKIFKEKQKADHLYIVKDGEFCLQTSVDYQPPKDPARYNYEEFNRKYRPANQNKAIRKIQLAVLSKGELFGDYEVFSEIPRCMDAICNSQKGEVFCISIQNLINRCEILNERDLLVNLKQNSQAKHGIHEKMLKYFHGTSSSFQSILVNNQKLIADQRNTDCVNVSRSQSNSRQNIKTAKIVPNKLISVQNKSKNSNEQLPKEYLYEPLFITANQQNQPRGMSAPSSTRNRNLLKTTYNNLIDEQLSKQDSQQTETNRSSTNDANSYFQRFSDKVLEFSTIDKKSQLCSQNSKKIDCNDNDTTYNITQNSQERLQSRQVPKINMQYIKQNQTPKNYLNQSLNRPLSSERSNFNSSVRNKNNSFIQIQNQSVANSPRGKISCNENFRITDLSKSQLLKQNKRLSYSKNTSRIIDKSTENIVNVSQQIEESEINLTAKLKNIAATSVVRKQIQLSCSDNVNFEKDLKSEQMIKAKKQILSQLNNQAQKQLKQLYQSVDLQQNQVQNSSSIQNSFDNNKAIDQSFKPSLAFSKLQINQHIDYNETRKQVLRKMRKFKQINYLNELKKSKIDQDKINSEYSKINTIKSKGYVVINPHAFINFVNIS
ncbi:cyclic nucleotide-binding domain protein (macronuclear) [Tetrahymena thermophila SB210]|uniref:Cyclic nucleotide-binding domain protein n=1 Tax=Tetrahymena thermophila (strain SB210) TaxID=312017 RepID=I7MAE6_TETTS|nr:cyclic nucleotide-binding domain protein [Tetrahymena thermophila SB210]EAS04434.2 cyclic nucleotide-binding domain protein [Tetrahymena thermophila SB210]|eukprot:XP_001024679.2 cyclic nucleotide-binding domain protein [Tetrahymena thermophila SB210]